MRKPAFLSGCFGICFVLLLSIIACDGESITNANDSGMDTTATDTTNTDTTNKDTTNKDTTNQDTATQESVDTNSTIASRLQIDTGDMALIHARNMSFTMGSSKGEADEQPPHTVTFTYDYWIDCTEVAQKCYIHLMDSVYRNYSPPTWDEGAGDRYPVYHVNWYEAALFCNAKSRRDGLDTVYEYTQIEGRLGDYWTLRNLKIDFDAPGYRLPTEAEWEYACRAGSDSTYFWGRASVVIASGYAWFSGNSKGVPHEVRQKKPNDLGLYDISGNVAEWCNDWKGEYPSEVTDPTGPESGARRIYRGGDWESVIDGLRAADRFSSYPGMREHDYTGFRTVLPVR